MSIVRALQSVESKIIDESLKVSSLSLGHECMKPEQHYVAFTPSGTPGITPTSSTPHLPLPINAPLGVYCEVWNLHILLDPYFSSAPTREDKVGSSS